MTMNNTERKQRGFWLGVLVLGLSLIVIGIVQIPADNLTTLKRQLQETDSILQETKAALDSVSQELKFFQRYVRPDSALLHQNIIDAGRHSNEEADSLTRWFITYGMQTGISPRVLFSVAHTESRWRRWAVSSAGALGIMQVMPRIWWGKFDDECGVWRRGDARANICYGAHILAHYRNLTGSLRTALGAYYAGPRNHSRADARQYIQLVNRSHKHLTGATLIV